MAWGYLLIAGVCEIMFVLFLKLSNNFSKLMPSIGFIIFSGFSFFFMSKAAKSLGIGITYAMWTGIGAVGSLLLSYWLFQEHLNIKQIVFVALLIFSMVGLKLSS